MSFLVREDSPQLGAASQILLDNVAVGTGGLGASVGNFGKVPREVYVTVGNLGATSTSFTAFISDDAYQVVGVTTIFGTASSAGTLNVEVAADGVAAGSGTAVLTGTVALTGTANTKKAGTLTTNVTNLQVAAGSHINILLGGTLTSLANCAVTIALVRV